jgi:hypothetical protein
MAVTPTSLIRPLGPITPELFPGKPSNVLEQELEEYIDRAETDNRVVNEPNTERIDPLVRALTLYYVFNDAYIAANARPLTVQVTEKGGHGFSTEQIRNLRALRDQYLAEFTGLLTPSATGVSKKANAAVRNVFTW